MILPAYWKVENDIYHSDVAASIAATSRHRIPELVFTDISDGPLWRTEPPESIFTYIDAATRALDAKFDKIILMYSGGTDSHTVLDSFVRCGIRNVEICMNNTEDHKNCPDRATTNKWATDVLTSEYKFLFTDYGYTFNDRKEKGKTWDRISKDDMHDVLNTFSGCFESQIYPSYGGAKFPSSLHLADSKKTAVVWGLEKPIIRVVDGWLCSGLSTAVAEGNNLGPNVDFENVYFFISKDVPELQIKLAWLRMKEVVSVLKELDLPITNENAKFIQSSLRSFAIYNRINKACGYRAASSVLDSAASKRGTIKMRSNATAKKAFIESGLDDVVASFCNDIRDSIHPNLWNTVTNAPRVLLNKPIKLKEVY
jgi:hypothetical protein